MKTPTSQSGIFNPRLVLTFGLCSVGVFLAVLSFGASPTNERTRAQANVSADSLITQPAQLSSNRANAATADPGWSIVPSPSVSGAPYNFLNAVACVSPSDCWAVGDYAAAKFQTLIEHWDGTSWSIVTSPAGSS